MPTSSGEHGVDLAQRRRMSVDEWAAMGEDEPGELVGGFLVEEEVPDVIHEVIVTWLSAVVSAWLLPRGGLIGGAARFLVGPDKGRKSDVFVFFPESPKPRKRGISRRPPDIIIEVVSPTPRDARRDRIDKMAEYAAFGVSWYWIVDPEARTIEFHRRGPDDLYVHVLGASEASIDVPGCTGLTIDLDALWKLVDALPDDEPETT